MSQRGVGVAEITTGLLLFSKEKKEKRELQKM